MMAVSDESRFPPIDDVGGFLITLACIALIAFGKENATINAVLFTVIGKMFGKYQRKSRK